MHSNNKYRSLIGAALAVPGLGLSASSVLAQVPAESATVRFKYADYRDFQPGEDRMRIQAPMVWLRAPLGENLEFDGSFVLDSMGGASPYYLDSLTGSSGMGVEDTRRAGDFKVTRYFDGFSVGLGGALSDEDDYESRGGSIDISTWTPDKNTIFSFGVGASWDDITSSIDTTLDENKETQSYMIGVTQVLNEVSVMQMNLTYGGGDGHFTDSYKPLDHRPSSRDQIAWLTRYNRYLPDDSSLHADYRMYFDSWGINSHMVDVAWYKPIGESWMVRPSVRYYTQTKADFFMSDFPPAEDFTGFLSADQRVSAFGGMTFGLRIDRELWNGFSADIAFDYLVQNQDLTLGSSGSRNIEPFFARMISAGLRKKF